MGRAVQDLHQNVGNCVDDLNPMYGSGDKQQLRDNLLGPLFS